MKKLLFLFLALVLAACSAAAPKSDLELNQQKWQDANIKHYRFQLNIGCFCAYRDQMPLTVEVKDGQIMSMINANGDVVTDTDPAAAFMMTYATIDNIFAVLNTEEVKNADQATVSYDPTYGFPVDVSVDYSQQMADEELYLNLSGFEALP